MPTRKSPDSGKSVGVIEKLIDFSARKRFIVLLAAGGLTLWGIWSAFNARLDALPDLSDTQVIVATEWMGRSPTLIENQITYPVVTTFLGAPEVKTVRGLSMFGMSFVYVVFKDGTDLYWARSRVVEYLAKVKDRLPEGVTPQIGPDATSVGWVFQYALIDEKGEQNLQKLRSFQDWHLRYWLQGLEGVAEVASVGGFEKEYQIQVDPARMKARNVSVGQIASAVRGANAEVGGRVIEMSQHEYVLRGRGYVADKEDLELAVVTTDSRGTPIRIQDVADVSIGGNIRRGLVDLDGRGEVVGGIVVMRSGENAVEVIKRVKAKLLEVKDALPAGTKIAVVYDRSELIKHSVSTLTVNLLQILIVVIIVISIFLFHFRSAMVAAITLPVATAATFILFYYFKISINIMSLAGIILALGDMVDSACVLVENAHRKIAEAEQEGSSVDRKEIIIAAARELGPSMFGALLVLTIAFLPVFSLQGEEGRLFRPLALAKTFSMAFAALFSVTLVPVLMVAFLKGKIRPIEKNPVNRFFIAIYRPLLRFCLRWRYAVIGTALVIVLGTIFPFLRLGSEFMPPLYEEDLLFMPITVPGIAVAEAKRLLQWQDGEIKKIPEVDRVFGKAGRAESSLDPAPLSMFETIVHLKPQNQWRRGMTLEKLIAELDERTRTPGIQGAWTMPIKARIDMLSTGIRTPVGVKVFGPDLNVINQINNDLEKTLRSLPKTRSVYAERELGGFFIDVIPNREAIARYGLTVRDVLDVVESGVGGMDVATTYEGRERYRINVRYPRELRDHPEMLKNILVPISPLLPRPLPRTAGIGGSMSGDGGSFSGMTSRSGGRVASGGGMSGMEQGSGKNSSASAGENMSSGSSGRSSSGVSEAESASAFVLLGQLASIETVMGPPMIKSEMGSITGWVYVDIETSDVGTWVSVAKEQVKKELVLPAGYFLKWTGQYEFLERVRAQLSWILPLTIGIVFLILYLNLKGIAQSLIVMTSVPFSAVGAIWMLYAFGFNTSVAVWVGMIALLGVASETASVMVVYLDNAWNEGRSNGSIRNVSDLVEISLNAGTLRVRAMLMTVLANVFGLLPILLDSGVGSDVAKRIAAPMWGGLVSLTILTLFIIPGVYVAWRSFQLKEPVHAKR
ncbi:MAG: efflux RND transporter permease subunit [Spirochaetia bacterium]|nr:efflux RND transporter permease subunit [Spirochaetia bacterium]